MPRVCGGRADVQRLFEAVPGLFLVLRPDADFTVVAASREYREALRADAALFGRPLAEWLPGDPQQAGAGTLHKIQASLRRVAATGRPETMPVQQFDLRRSAEGGGGYEARYWRPVHAPVLDEQGAVELIVHRVHEAAAGANQDAIAILDSITEGFYTLDRQWRFDYVNREACRILGRRPGELSGQVVWEAYPGLEGTETAAGLQHRDAGRQDETGRTAHLPLSEEHQPHQFYRGLRRHVPYI